jgi:Zn-finger protein
MDNKTRKVLEKHIETIVAEFNFLKRQKTDVSACPCYSSSPCHSNIAPQQLNCLFCLCPNYLNFDGKTCCKIDSSSGKWFYHPSYPTGKVWDCSDCDYPHRTNNVKKELRKLWGISEG